MVDRYSLVSIAVHNFRGLQETTIDFTDNGKPRDIMTFYGDQGSGKSTLILAIQWCAYGTRTTSNRHKLSKKNLFPSNWKNEQKEDIIVMMRFRPAGIDINSENDIQCKRTLAKNSDKDELEVIIGTEQLSGIDAKTNFTQIFGSNPKFQEGVMWVVRNEEMIRMATTISNDESNYFLDFMNLNVPRNGLIELNKTSQKNIKALVNSGNGSSNSTELLKIRQQIKTLEKKERKNKKIREGINKNLVNLKPTDQMIETAEAGTLYREKFAELELAESNLKNKKIRKEELHELINVLLFSEMKKKGITPERSFDGTKYEWEEIAEYLEKTDLFKSEVINEIRNLDQENGYDTSNLFIKQENIDKWKKRIKDLKAAMKKYYGLKSMIREFNDKGVDANSTEKAQQSIQNYEDNNDDLDRHREEAEGLNEQLETLREYEIGYSRTLEADGKNKIKLGIQNKRGTVIRGLIDAIDKTNIHYKNKMFNETIKRVKYYWKEIDRSGRYEPVHLNDEMGKPQFALKRIKDGVIHNIQIDQKSGNASGGEQQLLLVCTCLAVAESSGAKMPIILDDCFTEVDKNTREKLVKTVAENFGSMIFVTNDPDKADLLDKTQGTLELDWKKGWLEIHKNNQSQWKKWR